MAEMTVLLRINPSTQKRDIIVDRRSELPLSLAQKRAWAHKLTRNSVLKISGLGRIFFIEAESK